VGCFFSFRVCLTSTAVMQYRAKCIVYVLLPLS